MSQSESFEKYPKRKYLASPRKKYFSPNKKKTVGKTSPNSFQTRSPKGLKSKTLLHYFSPTSEKKEVGVTSENIGVNKEILHNISNKQILKRNLFNSKNVIDQKEVIVITEEEEDEDDEIKNFALHFNPGKKKESKREMNEVLETYKEHVKEDSFSNPCLNLLDELDTKTNLKSKNNDELIKVEIKPEVHEKGEQLSPKKMRTELKDAIQSLEIKIEAEKKVYSEINFKIQSDDELTKVEVKSEVLNVKKETTLSPKITPSPLKDTIPDDNDGFSLDNVREVIIPIKSPVKTPKKVGENLTEIKISPVKSVTSVEDIASLVTDVDWWDEEDFEDVDNISSPNRLNMPDEPKINFAIPEIANGNSDLKKHDGNTTLQKGQTMPKVGTSRKDNSEIVNSEVERIFKTSSSDNNVENRSNQNRSLPIDNDLLYYIISTPPASIAWNTIFLHSQYQNIYKKYHSLASEEKRLYSRLFQRKYDWIRVENIKYDFIPLPNISLTNLATIGFVKFFVPDEEDLTEVLNLMQLDEVKKACDIVKVNKKGKKSDMIENILKRIRTQPSLNFRSGTPAFNRVALNIISILPQFIKLEEEPRNLFLSFLLISSYPMYKSRDDSRMHIVVDLLYRLNSGNTRELDLPLSPVPIFKTLAVFHEYEESVNLVDRLLEAKKEKRWEEAKELTLRAKLELNIYLKNSIITNELEKIPDYLRKYTSGSNYVYALNEGIEVLKKDKSTSGTGEVIECLLLLLSQKTFRKGQRANWHCELAFMFERWKKFDEVFITLKQGLEEEHLTPLGKLILAQRCEMLIKRKHGLSVPQKEDLALLSYIQPYRFSTTTIPAKAMPNISTNKKQIWTIESDSGREYMGVEEIVRQHYISPEGGSFSEGCHDEGKIIINLVLCAFWSIIYTPLDGMFHVRLQNRPIDWGSSSFYRNRVELIQEKIDRFKLTGINGIVEEIQGVCSKHFGTLSIVSWDLIKLEQLSKLKEFLECVGTVPFLKFSDYLLQSYKERSSGLPDLTLWNVDIPKCLFVEVKGPSDKLSTKQILWLQKLNEFGIEAEVCHVHTLHTGKRDIPTEGD